MMAIIRNEWGDVVYTSASDEDAVRWWFAHGSEGDQIHTECYRANDGTEGLPVEEAATLLFPRQPFTYTPDGRVSTPNGRLDDERQNDDIPEGR